MNARNKLLYSSLLLAALFFGHAGSAFADEKVAATNAVPSIAILIPPSVFDVGLTNGRDPFFPRSSRRPIGVPAGEVDATEPTGLVLQGLSHSTKRPLATINNRTLSLGEESEVISPNGSRLRIRCEAINDTSVVIVINGGQRLELKMTQ